MRYERKTSTIVKLKGDGQGGLPSPMIDATTKCSTKMRLCVSVVKPRPNSVYCTLSVDGIPTNFLTDSGAEISLLPSHHEAVVSQMDQLQPADIQPVAVDGSPIPLSGSMEVLVTINGRPIKSSFYITTDSKIPPILGLDVMRKLEYVNINFQDGAVSFGPVKQSEADDLSPKNPKICHITNSYRVEIDCDAEILPRHQVRLVGNLIAVNKEELVTLNGKTLLLEPTVNLENLACARALVTSEKGKIPLLICNPFDKKVHLKEGLCVGSAETIPSESVIATLQEDDELERMSAGKTSECAAEVIHRLCDEAEVTHKERTTLNHFVTRNQDVFSINGEMGRYKGNPFVIDTGNARPIRQMPRPVPYHRKAEVDRQLDEMLEKGIIEPANSEWASPILLVPKSDGTLRFCIDYRRLNAVTKHDAFPLPNINDCLSSLGNNSKFFSTVDCYHGYWQVEMDPKSQDKAAFTTHRGLFKPKVLPFGPRGGVAHFSRVMSALLGSLQWKMLLIYLDDLLIFSDTFEEHLRRLDLVFKILRESNLKLKPSKCQLLRRSVNFLGHLVSSDGIAPNAEKIRAVHDWKAPTNLEELKRFIGFASYYRRYIKDFATKCEPLNKLTRKKTPFHWDANCDSAFEFIKTSLTQHPVLAHPDFKVPFQLTTDASATGLGAVLSQIRDGKERPIAYASRTLTNAERNYSTTERECLAVVWATEHFDYFLSGAAFTVVTDHDPLTYLRSIDQPHGRLARWILRLEQYNFKIRHLPGTAIPHADALSRRDFPVTAVVQLPNDLSSEDLVAAQEKDPIVQKVRSYWRLQQHPPPTEKREVKDFFARRGAVLLEVNGVLYIRSKFRNQEIMQLVTPSSLVCQILTKGHDDAGHLGADRTLEIIRQKYYWATLFRDVKAWCKTCQACQHRKNPIPSPRAPLQFPPIAARPGQMIAIDFVGPLPETAAGNKHLLVITDMFSKYADAIPCPNQEATTTADALVQKYFSKQGLPEILHSDQGRNFESQLIQHLCSLMNIQKTRTSPYHPSANGQCERYNKTLIEMLSLQVNENQTDWDKWVPLMLFAYNSTQHCSTNFTPFQLHIGRQPKTPFDTLAETLIDTNKKSAHDYLSEVKKKMTQMYKITHGNLGRAMVKRKGYSDRRANFIHYEKGDKVLLRQFTCKPGLKPKLLRERWTGPWTIDQVRGPVNFRITRKVGKKKHRVLVHHDRLKRFHERPNYLIENTHPKPQEADESQEAHQSTGNQLEAGDGVRVSDTEESDSEDEGGSDYESAEDLGDSDEVEDVDLDEGDSADGGDGVDEGGGVDEGDNVDEGDGVDEGEDVNEVEAANLQAEEEIPRTTRSGRTVKTPSRFTF